MRAVDLLIQCLEAEGVDHAWGYPGGAIMPLYDALLESKIKHHLVRHEQAAAFAAQGYARSTGRVGLCIATSGPGATNLLTGVADAFLDSVPIVAITGQVPTTLMGTDAFQEVDVIGMYLPVVKHSFLIRSAEDIPRIVRDAFRIAREGRPGPVIIDIPKDVQNAQVPGLTPIGKKPTPPMEAPDPRELAAASELMDEAKKPIIYAGGGVAMAGATETLREFARVTGAPTVHTLKGLGAIPATDPNFLGMLGMHGLKGANLAVQECDLLLAVGARFDDRVTGKLDTFAPHARVVHMDIDAAELGKLRRAQAPVRGDIIAAMRALSKPCGTPEWSAYCRGLRDAHAWDYNAPFDSIYAPRLIRTLCDRAPANTFVCCDVGQHQMWIAQHWRFNRPEHHLTSAGLGTMGFGLPAAVGVATANPDATVICASGDGSFQMNIQELATVAREQLPVKILLLDNSALGMVRQWQELFFKGRESSIDLSDNPDFTAVAAAYGIKAQRFEGREAEADAIDAILNSKGPFLAQCRIDRSANVWPLVPPGSSNLQMMDDPTAPKREPASIPA